MKRIVLVTPTEKQQNIYTSEHFGDDYQFIPWGEYSIYDTQRFDPAEFIESTVDHFRSQSVDGVISPRDFPGTLLAAAIANQLHLPGPSFDVMLRSHNKYYGRVDQQQYVPEATPSFTLIDPAAKGFSQLSYPLFVKPVKSYLSILAKLVRSPQDLQTLIRSKATRFHMQQFVRPYNDLVREFSDLDKNGSYFIGETPLQGMQITLEGYVQNNEITILGVTDSVMYPGTISFARFDYPSQLPIRVQNAMADITKRLVRDIGFRESLFNIEMMYEPHRDKISIIEFNPRMAYQFADFYEKVHGLDSHYIQFALATGETPAFQRDHGEFTVAASYVLRLFKDQYVRRVPTNAELADLAREYPDAVIDVGVEEDTQLSTYRLQDISSYVYARINLGGNNRADLDQRYKKFRAYFDQLFDFEEVT